MRKPLRWRQFVAWWYGKFWKPCPQCGQWFGGHEDRGRSGHVDSIPLVFSERDNLFTVICPDCVAHGVGCRAHAAIGWYHKHDCEFVPYPPPGVFQ